MKAQDILRTGIATVNINTPLSEIAELMVQHHACSLPVIGDDDRVIGLVSEDDFLRRIETGTLRQRNKLAEFFTSSSSLQEEYIRSRGLKAGDVMQRNPPHVSPDTPLCDIADYLENHNINSVLVTNDDRLVGVVSRSDLVRAFVSSLQSSQSSVEDDKAIHDALLTELGTQPWGSRFENAIFVTDGVVHLWGHIASPTELAALRVAAERIPGVKHVHDHTVPIKPTVNLGA